MLQAHALQLPCGPVVLMDTITKVAPAHAGCIVISGSHGGSSSAAFALVVSLRLAVFNDAGVGKDEAGVVALNLLQSAGMPAAAVSHLTARIGDAQDTWDSGVISRVNPAARAMGLAEGRRLQEAVLTLPPPAAPSPA